jgi:predicted phosphodiesterase
MTQVDCARKYRNKHGMDMPTLKLARIMYAENVLLFKNVEGARSAIRSIEGKNAGKNCTVTHPAPERPKNPYNLPPSEETNFEPYQITGHKRIGIMSDVHVPYHSIEAITTTIDYLKKENIDGLLLNGDTIDFYGLSRFEKDPKKRGVKYELDTFKALIEILERELKCKIYFKIGNHEERYEKFLYMKAGELSGVEEFTFENIIKARAKGIEIIGDKRVMKLNSLNGIHGHEYIGGISAPVNIARGLYLKGKTSAFQGHNHTTSEHTEPDMNGKITTTWSIGCLCELHPMYMPLNKWNHGCAIVELDANGEDYEFRNKRIYKGKMM